MEMMIINAAKYMILIAGIFFTALTLFATVKGERYQGKAVFHVQMLMITVIQICALAVAAVRVQSMEVILFEMGQMVFIWGYCIFFRALYRHSNANLLAILLFCISIGLISMTRLQYDKAWKQFEIVCVFSILTLGIPSWTRKLTHVKVLAGTLGVLGLIALLAVPLIGSTEYGANLSIALGAFSFQPSEFVKITFVLLIAVLLRKRGDFKRVCFATCIAAVHVLVLVVSTDLGGALIFFLTYLCMLHVATGKPIYLILGLAAGCVAGVLAYYLFSHVRVRVTAWKNPWSAIDTSGYQIAQSLFALGSGGWFGTGLYEGSANSIPVVIKDYIFSAIAEEFGAVFAICLMLNCFCCFCTFLLTASEYRVKYFRLIGTGLACIYGIQTCLSIGGVIKFIPATGVTLPLVSYGGSSVCSTLLLFGLMQGLHLMDYNEKERYRLFGKPSNAASAFATKVVPALQKPSGTSPTGVGQANRDVAIQNAQCNAVTQNIGWNSYSSVQGAGRVPQHPQAMIHGDAGEGGKRPQNSGEDWNGGASGRRPQNPGETPYTSGAAGMGRTQTNGDGTQHSVNGTGRTGQNAGWNPEYQNWQYHEADKKKEDR